MKKLYITNNKNEVLRSYSNILTNTKVITEKGLLSIYPYKFSYKIIDYIMNKYNVIYDIALIYYENIIKYPIENGTSDKCIFLSNLKQELIDKNLLQENKLYKNYLMDKEIIIDEYAYSKYLMNLLNGLNVTVLKTDNLNYTPKVYELSSMEEEIVFVLESIADLIRNNVSVNHIYLTNVKDEYLYLLKRISKQMHIPVIFHESCRLSDTPIGIKYMKGEEINPKSQEEESIYNQIIDIINKYVDIDNPEKLIEYDLKHTRVRKETQEEGIRIVNIKNINFTDNDYVFLLNCNNEFPREFSDDDYLSDSTKENLGVDTSTDLNKIEREHILSIFHNTKNLTITFNKDSYPSTLLAYYEIKTPMNKFNVSEEYNKYSFAKMYDEYLKYGTITPTFLKMHNTYNIPYKTYSNKYIPISLNKLKFNKLNLSYTKLNTYLLCPYSYYLKYILRLDIYEETFSIIIGNIFHKILEESMNEEFDYEVSFNKNLSEYTLSNKEKKILNNLKDEFAFVLNLFEERKKNTDLNNYFHEREIVKKLAPNVTFSGKVDLIEYNDSIYKITDYKTGSAFIDASIMPLGLSLQLPTYLYLLKSDPEFQDKICGGFYLQPILLDKTEEKYGENYEHNKKDNYKAVGYSSKNFDVLKHIDYTYEDSTQIKGMKTTLKGDLGAYAKTFADKDLDNLITIVDDKIKEVSENIFNGNFSINPKILDNKTNISCEYCKFKDICFHTKEDETHLNSDKTFMKEVKDVLDN